MKHPSKMNFLIVDDMDNMRRSIRAMLRLINFGREFFEAQNGLDAWNYLENPDNTIDFIISDYNMPQMTGTELLHRIRMSPKYRDIPFLMVTADTNMEIVAEAAEHDVDGYMTKPFVTATLEQKIQELLNQAKNPDALTLSLRAIRDLKEKGDIEGAIAEAKKAVTAHQQSSRPLRELGLLFMGKKDLKNAMNCFERSTDLNRLDVVSYHCLGQILFHLGRIDKATDNYARAMEISPRHADRALNFADLLLGQRKYREAEKVLKLVLRTNPDIETKERIADTCRNNKLPALAVKAYRAILKENPDRFYLTGNLGIALQMKGDNNEAIKALEQAVEIAGTNVELLLSLAQAYLDINKLIRADKWASQVLKIDPENQRAREILDKCL
ncbi:MAG: response regulator [Proteobacteria bacterium]|nr:response regulator [Pseudomonadota bacterium]MBU1709737.1 response regulator [Pseudomonadota bacterium]